MKKSININDVENFYQLNLQILYEFQKIIYYSNQTYQKILKNIKLKY